MRRRFRRAASARKFLSSSWPACDAMLSGWNCTPCSGRSRWTRPMIEPVLGRGGDAQLWRQARALDDERVIARRGEGVGQAREHARAVVMDRRRACHASGQARARPSRRTPGRSPGGRGTRPAPGSPPARRTSSRQMPARSGVLGPGDSTMPCGAQRQGVRRRSARRCACTTTSAPELAEVMQQVVGEAVVVIDQQKHGRDYNSLAGRGKIAPSQRALSSGVSAGP